MKPLLSALLAVCLVFLQAIPAFHESLTVAGVRANAAFLAALWAAMRLRTPWSLIVPALTGLSVDLLCNARFGSYTFIFFFACLPAAALSPSLAFRQLPVFLTGTLVLSVLKCSLETAVCLWTFDRAQAFAFVRSAALPEIIATTLFAVPFFAVATAGSWISHQVTERSPFLLRR